ncbi:MAG: SNF2-related protein [Pirellulales bacterium]
MTEPSLARCCSLLFFPQDRERGEEYFQHGHVNLIEIGDCGIHAIAHGQSEYNVYIDFSELEDRNIGVHCDCPRFQGGDLCKHLWATLRYLDFVGYPFESEGSVAIYTLDFDKFDTGERILLDPKKSRNTSDYSSFDDDEEDFAEENDEQETEEEILFSDVYDPQSLWQHQLIRMVPSNLESSPPLLRTPFQPFYIFAIPAYEVPKARRFRILAYQSRRKKGGENTIPTKVSLSRYDLDQITDPLARRALEHLDWNQNQINHFGFPSLRDTRSDWYFKPESLAQILKLLCDEQRLVLNYGGEHSLQQTTPLVFGEATPWELEIFITGSDTSESLSVVPRIVRQTLDGHHEERHVENITALCESGCLFFEDQLEVTAPEQVDAIRRWREAGTLEVPLDEMKTLLRALTLHPSVPRILFDSRLPIYHSSTPPIGKLVLLNHPSDAHYFLAEVRFKYGQTEVSSTASQRDVWDAPSWTLYPRQIEAETQIFHDLCDFHFNENSDQSHELRIHRKWFVPLIRRVLELGWEVVAEGQIFRNPTSMHIKVRTEQDWFDVEGHVGFESSSIGLPSLLQSYRKGEHWIRLDDGSHGLLPEQWLAKYAPLADVGSSNDSGYRFEKNQALILDAMLASHENVQLDKTFTTLCTRLKKFSGVQTATQPKGLRGTLRNYQLEGLAWFQFLNEYGFGGCLADDMGLGKTIQVLALLESRRVRRARKAESKKPSIVIVPKSLVFNWIEEAEKFTPQLKLLDFTGQQRHAYVESLEQYDLVVTTYSTLRLDIERFAPVAFDYAILDEAQAIKNSSSQASKAVKLLNADHRLAMTGTPIENHLGDLWSLFEFLNPGMLGPSIIRNFTISVEEDRSQVLALNQALRPFILRRTKAQVLKELPHKTEQTLYCEMPPKQKKVYVELRDHYRQSLLSRVRNVGISRSKIQVLEALLRLRQAACDPRLVDPESPIVGSKIELLLEQLEEVIEEGHKVLVFSQFTSMLALVQSELESRHWNFEYLDGKTRNRAAKVERFQEDPKCSIFLISLKAGGVGLNLTAADYVYILDPWWNPAAEAQAIDRAHRMGQTKPVVAYRMICQDTVEARF